MEKTYNPTAIEQALYQTWEENGYFKPHGDTSKEAYSFALLSKRELLTAFLGS